MKGLEPCGGPLGPRTRARYARTARAMLPLWQRLKWSLACRVRGSRQARCGAERGPRARGCWPRVGRWQLRVPAPAQCAGLPHAGHRERPPSLLSDMPRPPPHPRRSSGRSPSARGSRQARFPSPSDPSAWRTRPARETLARPDDQPCRARATRSIAFRRLSQRSSIATSPNIAPPWVGHTASPAGPRRRWTFGLARRSVATGAGAAPTNAANARSGKRRRRDAGHSRRFPHTFPGVEGSCTGFPGLNVRPGSTPGGARPLGELSLEPGDELPSLWSSRVFTDCSRTARWLRSRT